MTKKLLAFIFLLIFTIFLIPFNGFCASSCKEAVEPAGEEINLVFRWTDADPASWTDYTTLNTFHGYITEITTDPGSTAPTASYDIYLNCTEMGGVDLAGTALENRSATATETTYPMNTAGTAWGWRRVDGKITLNIQNNAVASATGIIYVHIKPDKPER